MIKVDQKGYFVYIYKTLSNVSAAAPLLNAYSEGLNQVNITPPFDPIYPIQYNSLPLLSYKHSPPNNPQVTATFINYPTLHAGGGRPARGQ